MTTNIEGGSDGSQPAQAAQGETTQDALKSMVAEQQAEVVPVPDTVLPHDIAVDVAYAGKPLRDVASYHTQVQGIAQEFVGQQDATQQANREIREFYADDQESKAANNAALAASRELAQAKLGEAKDRLVRDVGETGARGRTTNKLDQVVGEVREQSRYPDEKPFNDTQAAFAEKAARLADQREEMAELIARNPEAAGGWDVNAAMQAERTIADQAHARGQEQYELTRMTKLEENGQLSVAGIESFAEWLVGGMPDDPAERSPDQQRWAELSSSDNTTVGQLKAFVKEGYQSRIDVRTESINTRQARLDAIRGITPPVNPTDQVAA